MAKPKSPLLSLGASGTIGDALTFQKRGQITIARTKPIPKDPYSLAQAYQRWLYRDYAYLWTLQTNAIKQTYRTRASRYHITGFSLWMREHLRDLPDIVGMWHLDEKGGAIAYDSSRNTNNAVITGCTPITGIIDGAFLWDGINDWLIIPDHPTLHLPSNFTLEAFVNKSVNNHQGIFSKGIVVPSCYSFIFRFLNTGHLLFGIYDDAQVLQTVTSAPLANDITYHIAAVASTTHLIIYVDGILSGSAVRTIGAPKACPTPLRIGSYWATGFRFTGLMDQLLISTRALSPTELLRHSQRRYPS